MRITVYPNIAACVAAGIEAVNFVDLDLAAMALDERALIAKYIKPDGCFSTGNSVLPTSDGLIAAARMVEEAEKEMRARQAAYATKEEQENTARQAAADAAFAARKVKVVRYAGSHRGRPYHYDLVQPDMPSSIFGTTYGYGGPSEPALDAWRAECQTVTEANQLSAKAAMEDQITREIAARAESLDWVPPHNPRHDPLTLINDNGERVLLRSSDTVGNLICTLTWLPHAPDKISAVYHLPDAAGCTVTTCPVAEGVLKISSAEWAALVDDPSAIKPVYNFLKHVPGGFDGSKITVGDILVYGWKTRKSKERCDRVVIEVNDTSIRVLQCDDYQEARKMRKAALSLTK